MLFIKMTGVAVGLFCVLTMAGCEGEKPKPAQTESVKIGVIYPFSGPFAPTGEDLKAGVDLAAEIVNGTFDLDLPMGKGEGLPSHGGARIKTIYRDSQNDTNQAAEMVEQLIKNEGVKAIIGCYSSTITAAASERAEMLNVPFLNEASTSPTLTQRGLRWFFRTTPHDEMFAQNFFSFLSEFSERMNIQIPRRLTLVYENRLWGTSVAQAERKLAIKHGYEIVEEVPYDAQKSHFDEELERIKRTLPGLILQSSYDADAILFMKGYSGHGRGFYQPQFCIRPGG
jgi:branched-chain amino acid transport system substrate-binding protein